MQLPNEIIEKIIKYLPPKIQVGFYFPNIDYADRCIWIYAVETDNLDIIKFLYNRNIYSLDPNRLPFRDNREYFQSDFLNSNLDPDGLVHEIIINVDLTKMINNSNKTAGIKWVEYQEPRENAGFYDMEQPVSLKKFSDTQEYKSTKNVLKWSKIFDDAGEKLLEAAYRAIQVNNLRIYKYLLDKIDIAGKIDELQEEAYAFDATDIIKFNLKYITF
jgi:hypothetical protein